MIELEDELARALELGYFTSLDTVKFLILYGETYIIRRVIVAGGCSKPQLHLCRAYLLAAKLYIERGITIRLSTSCYTTMTALPQPVDLDLQSKLKELESTPLFMKNLSDDPSNQGDALEALQALVHDGTPDGKCTVSKSVLLHLTSNLQRKKSPQISRLKEMSTSGPSIIVRPWDSTLKP